MLIIPSKTERLIQKNDFLLTRGHDFVEIGGIKWATCNVGAKCPADIGLYFQWGDTKGYTAKQVRNYEKRFNWHNYPINKYNATDGKTVLDISDDAVHAVWGGAWRMPTTEEFETLYKAVNTFWTDNYQGSGMSGMVLTDRTDSSKELFFPSTGYGFEGYIEDLEGSCYFWTRSLSFIDNTRSYYTRLGRSYINIRVQTSRTYGFPVRGIIKTMT